VDRWGSGPLADCASSAESGLAEWQGKITIDGWVVYRGGAVFNEGGLGKWGPSRSTSSQLAGSGIGAIGECWKR